MVIAIEFIPLFTYACGIQNVTFLRWGTQHLRSRTNKYKTSVKVVIGVIAKEEDPEPKTAYSNTHPFYHTRTSVKRTT